MRNKLTDELAVCGMNASLAVAEHHPDTINRLFLREDRLESFTGVCKKLAERKRPYKICEDEELERICKSVHHQGVVAMIIEPVIEPMSIEDLELWAAEGKTGLVLHSIGNDHNLGAIARAAAFFDASYIVVNEKDKAFTPQESPSQDPPQGGDGAEEEQAHASQVCLTTSAYRIAEGGFEHLTVRRVADTLAFIKDASKKLVTIGTDARARMRIGDISGILKNSKKRGVALVLGNEETGLPKNVKEQCTYLLRIPGTGNIESLNVSQAAALFLHAIFER
jgi:TrmH RNA methyltransferase